MTRGAEGPTSRGLYRQEGCRPRPGPTHFEAAMLRAAAIRHHHVVSHSLKRSGHDREGLIVQTRHVLPGALVLMLLGALNWCPNWYRDAGVSPRNIARRFVQLARNAQDTKALAP